MPELTVFGVLVPVAPTSPAKESPTSHHLYHRQAPDICIIVAEHRHLK